MLSPRPSSYGCSICNELLWPGIGLNILARQAILTCNIYMGESFQDFEADFP